MKLIFIIVFLFCHTNQLCGEGCLKCSKEDECQICDVTNFYKLIDKKCSQQQQDNCLLIDLSGNCLSCKQNFYIEPQLKKCIEIGLANRIQNCVLYDSKLNCTLCDEGFFIAGSVCKVQEKSIENCKYYQDVETCLECKSNYIVSIDKLSCTNTSSNQNCLKFSKVKCNQCQSGYIFNELAFESQWYNSTSLFEKDKLMTLIVGNDFKSLNKQYVCQKQLVSNCEEFLSLDKCAKCSFGFYLSQSGQCIVNPFPSIQNCEVYSNKNSCQKCKQMFYRQSEISCVKVQEISNCKIYSQVDNFTKCEECETSFYLNKNEKCIERENRVDNCFEYEINLDVCKKCSDSFVLTDDKLNCLSKLDNCMLYRPSTYETVDLECYKCVNGFHLNGKICEKGTIDNCEVYSINSTHTHQICERCKNQFILANQTCIQSQKITNCDVYHPHTQNACQQCLSENQNILLGKVCVDQPLVANCKVYQQVGEVELQCQECSDGYYLTEEFNCSEIQIENCVQLDEDCQKCADGFFLTNNQCVPRPAVHSFNCDSDNYTISKIFSLGCQTCKENFFPLDIGKNGVCFEENFLPENKHIDNCLQYDTTNSSMLCSLCKEGFFKSSQSGKIVCVQSQCPTATQAVYRAIDNINFCQQFSSNLNCQIMTVSYDDGDDICTKCKSNQIQVINSVYSSSLLYSIVNTSTSINLYDDPLDRNFSVNCVAKDSLSSSDIVENCQYYQHIDSVYKCIKCIDFYTGTFTGNDSISSCQKDNQFTEKKIYNFSAKYGIIQSGYECSDDLQIPWLNIRDESAKGLCTVDTSNLSVDYTNNLQNRSNFCANPSIIDSSFNIPQNCGTILTKSNFASEKCDLQSIECLYCKPKFKPTYTDSLISQCTFIDHCIGDKWFNACSKCENGYSYKFSSDDVYFDECVENSDNNCYALDVSAEACMICKTGYTLIKGVCELIVTQKCKVQSAFQFLSPSDYYSSVDVNYASALQFNQKYMYNCSDCQQGFVSLIVSSYNFCIESSRLTSLQSSQDFATDSTYIQNCSQYKNDKPSTTLTHTCEKCLNDLFAFDRKCITPLANCEVVEEDDSDNIICAQCQSGYGKQGDNCVISEVSHCSINATFNTCGTCEQGYYLEEGKCLKSDVENCEVVTDQLKCSKCFDGFFLYETESEDYCFPQPSDIKCKEGKIYQDSEFGSQVICESCPKVNQILLSDSNADFEFKSVCAPIQKVEHCIKYNENKIFYIENFDCVECAADYYLDNNECKERLLKVENCSQYDLAKDECQLCQENFYKEENKCVANPFGIQGCLIYENSDSCLECESNKFSQEGLCYNVLEENKIENCEVYETGTLCQSCQTGYFLQDNTCIKSQLQNCLEFESATVCKKCQDQYQLTEDETKTFCQKVEKQRCLLVDLVKENKPCLQCEFLFYVNLTTGDCDEVPKENRIDNCIAYINDRECQTCDVGYVLSKDKLLCSKNPLLVNQIPDNCKEAQEQDLFCAICKGGYKIKNGQCTQCVENNWNSGCFYCLSDYEGCYICRPGYVMNKDQKCTQGVINSTDTEVEQVEFTTLKNVFYFLALLFLI